MRILVGHNYYQQPGGEDSVARFEADLLRKYGHEVLFVEFFNKDFNHLSLGARISNILSWGWSQRSYNLIREHCLNFRPDIAHFHNTFFMATPSVYAACRSSRVPVVQTLHNFRLLCSNGLFYHDGHVCEECLSHSLSQGIKYGCYRHSRVLTWAVVRMLKEHRKRETWTKDVAAFIVMTEFARCKFELGGIPRKKIWVKPNCILKDPGAQTKVKDYFVYAGRLSEEKGVDVLLEAFRELTNVPLVMMGDGPLKKTAEAYIKQYGLTNIRLRGFLEKESYYDILKEARALIVPSVCYENFPVAIVEAYACGLPVIASDLGAMKELVIDGHTGLLFKPANAVDLASKLVYILSQDEVRQRMGRQSRALYEQRFSIDQNYQQLINIYQQCLQTDHGHV